MSPNPAAMRVLDADAVAALGPADAVRAITDVLRGGLDPATDPPRAAVGLSNGQFLLMPAEAPAAAGVRDLVVAEAVVRRTAAGRP